MFGDIGVNSRADLPKVVGNGSWQVLAHRDLQRLSQVGLRADRYPQLLSHPNFGSFLVPGNGTQAISGKSIGW